jgi:hypothetical protein
MTHSSELMPGDSPNWPNVSDAAGHLEIYRHVFNWWINNKVEPKTLGDFASKYSGETKINNEGCHV